MDFLNSFLEWDKNLLISAQTIISPQYAYLLQIASEGVVIWVMGLLVGLWLYGTFKKDEKYKIASLQIFGLIASVFLIYGCVYFFIPQWRPHPGEIIQQIMQPLIPHPLDNSFPSGHAIFTTALFFGTLFYQKNKIIVLVTFILGCITLISRVLGGVHYPGDILGGIILATIGVFLLRGLSEKIVSYFTPHLIKIAKIFKL